MSTLEPDPNPTLTSVPTVDVTDEPVTIDLRDPVRELAAVGVVTPDGLTHAERGVLEAVASGLSNEQIASELGITRHTVKTHVRHVTEKLGAVNRTDAARMLLRARSA